MFAELFTVDEQMDMWDRMNAEQPEFANRLLTEGMKHGNQQDNIVAKMQEAKLLNFSDGKVIFAEYGAGKAGLSSFVA